MSIEAMKQALEALVLARGSIEDWGGYASEYFQNKHDLKGDMAKADRAITALRQALEQPADEPAGCMRCNTPKKCSLFGCSPLTWPSEYTHPQPKAEQEPVAEITIKNGYWIDTPFAKIENLTNGTHKLYTSPQPQTERNFCGRCGKRTADLTVIHTCTPPQGEDLYDLAVKADNGGQP